MLVGEMGHFASAGSALDETLLDQEWLIDLLYRAGILAEGGGDCCQAHGAAAELVDDCQQNLIVDFVEAVTVDIEGLKGHSGDVESDGSVPLHHSEVTHAAKKRVGYTGSATASEGDFHGGLLGYSDTEQPGGASHDTHQHLVVIILKVAVDTESGAQGGCQETAACGGSDQSEGGERQLHALRAGPLVEQDIDTVILHGGVEILLHDRVETVDFVDKEHVVRFERHEDTGEIARFVEDGAGCDLEADAEFVGDDIGKGGFTQAGRAVEECMVEGLTAQACRLHENAEIGYDFLLAAEIIEGERAQGLLDIAVGIHGASAVMYIERIVCLHSNHKISKKISRQQSGGNVKNEEAG